MIPEIEKLAARFSRRCYRQEDFQDLKQQAYLIYLEHKDSHDPTKSSLNTWANNFLFKKMLTYLNSASYRNQKRFVPEEDIGNRKQIATSQLSLDMVRAIKSLTDDELYAINKYDRKLAHHHRGPFGRNIKRIKAKLEDV